MWPNAGQEYFYDKHEWVRVRVEQEHWQDLSPVAPAERESASALERKSPYSITVRFSSEIMILCLLEKGLNDAIRTRAYSMVVTYRHQKGGILTLVDGLGDSQNHPVDAFTFRFPYYARLASVFLQGCNKIVHPTANAKVHFFSSDQSLC